jgi:hypothetical protein
MSKFDAPSMTGDTNVMDDDADPAYQSDELITQ